MILHQCTSSVKETAYITLVRPILEYASYSAVQQKHTPNVNKLDRRPRPPASAVATPGKPCYRCGGPHSSAKCRFKEASCHLCKKLVT